MEEDRVMKILLIQNLIYIPTLAGSNKSNRLLLEELSERNHICQAIVPASGAQTPRTTTQFLEELRMRGVSIDSSSPEAKQLYFIIKKFKYMRSQGFLNYPLIS
jgi:hypothetical protein